MKRHKKSPIFQSLNVWVIPFRYIFPWFNCVRKHFACIKGWKIQSLKTQRGRVASINNFLMRIHTYDAQDGKEDAQIRLVPYPPRALIAFSSETFFVENAKAKIGNYQGENYWIAALLLTTEENRKTQVTKVASGSNFSQKLHSMKLR